MKLHMTHQEKHVSGIFCSVFESTTNNQKLLKIIKEIQDRLEKSVNQPVCVLKRQHAVFLRAVVSSVLENIVAENKEGSLDIPMFKPLTNFLYKLELKLENNNNE